MSGSDFQSLLLTSSTHAAKSLREIKWQVGDKSRSVISSHFVIAKSIKWKELPDADEIFSRVGLLLTNKHCLRQLKGTFEITIHALRGGAKCWNSPLTSICNWQNSVFQEKSSVPATDAISKYMSLFLLNFEHMTYNNTYAQVKVSSR